MVYSEVISDIWLKFTRKVLENTKLLLISDIHNLLMFQCVLLILWFLLIWVISVVISTRFWFCLLIGMAQTPGLFGIYSIEYRDLTTNSKVLFRVNTNFYIRFIVDMNVGMNIYDVFCVQSKYHFNTNRFWPCLYISITLSVYTILPV